MLAIAGMLYTEYLTGSIAKTSHSLCVFVDSHCDAVLLQATVLLRLGK
jgi:hypothetical protein